MDKFRKIVLAINITYMFDLKNLEIKIFLEIIVIATFIALYKTVPNQELGLDDDISLLDMIPIIVSIQTGHINCIKPTTLRSKILLITNLLIGFILITL